MFAIIHTGTSPGSGGQVTVGPEATSLIKLRKLHTANFPLTLRHQITTDRDRTLILTLYSNGLDCGEFLVVTRTQTNARATFNKSTF